MAIWSKTLGHLGQILTGECWISRKCQGDWVSPTRTATVLTSLAFHLLFVRCNAAAERARYTARISILESLVRRLKTAEPIEASEIERLTTLSRKLQEGHETHDFEDF